MSYERVLEPLQEEDWAILAAAMKAGAYAFFVASGLSREAGLPTGAEAAEELIRIHVHADDPIKEFREIHDLDGPLELPIVAQLLERQIGREKLIRFLRHSVNWDVSPAPVHRFITLLSLSMKERDKAVRVVTTNYDTLIEDSLPPRTDVFVLEEHYTQGAHEARPWVLKLHGCIRTSARETIRITQSDLAQPLESWKQDAMWECLQRKGLIVVGYGGTDIHVSRMISDAIQKAPERSYWVSTGQPPEDVITSLARSEGRLISMNATAFFRTAKCGFR